MCWIYGFCELLTVAHIFGDIFGIFFTDGVVLHGFIHTSTQTLLVANVRFFFSRGYDPVEPIHNFPKGIFTFCLNRHIIVAFDLTKILFPFSICVLVCVTLGSTSPIITKDTVHSSQRKQC